MIPILSTKFVTAVHRLVTYATAVLAEESDKTWLETIRQFAREQLGPPLKAFHVPIDNWLGSLPMTIALACAVGLYVIALIWVWGLKREFVFRGAPDEHWWRDLRIWATVVTIPYIAMYLWLGI